MYDSDEIGFGGFSDEPDVLDGEGEGSDEAPAYKDEDGSTAAPAPVKQVVQAVVASQSSASTMFLHADRTPGFKAPLGRVHVGHREPTLPC